MRKGSLMKFIFTNLMTIVALGGIVAACNSGPAIGDYMPGTGGTGGEGTGGTGGTGNTGGGGTGACTDTEDQDVYANLSYTNEAGDTFTGSDAASEIGSDCIFGTTSSDPVLSGCAAEAAAVLGCGSGCPPATIQALADCVAQCTQDGTAEASPPGLSSACVACTGDTVACGATYCVAQCVADTNAPQCIQCRCDNNCIQEFDSCSGLPSGGECTN